MLRSEAMAWIPIVLIWLLTSAGLTAQGLDRQGFTGQQIYETACAACHGRDGRGQPLSVRGFDLELPDFTDCSLTTPEADLDWHSVVHQGGPVRAFDRMMPAFGDELTTDEITLVVAHVRTFCRERGWPAGDLNLPRPLVTEKAYPENEAVLTATMSRDNDRPVSMVALYEHRVGRRGQYEIAAQDLDEITGAYKHVLFDSLRRGAILSAGGEVTAHEHGAVFEAFGAFSQALPRVRDGFLHAHAGFEVPTASTESNEVFGRLAIGKSFMEHTWGRAWSPMFELLAARPLGDAAETEIDVLPQMQVSLSTRQHVLLSAGVRVPLTQRSERRTSVLTYLLWDWFDGGFFSGW
jgi:mono/diheme cytochrome c family protein